MKKYNCNAPGCGSPVTAHFVRAKNRVAVSEGHLCAEHAHGFLEDYRQSANAGLAGARSEPLTAPSFDPEVIFFDDIGDERGQVCRVFLVDDQGTRRFSVTIGPCEGQSLRLELKRFKAPRPLTHGAMAAAIEALGGQVQYVVVDKFSPSSEVAYEAKLNILQCDFAHTIDVRLSDALVLALICEVPIVILREVLEAIMAYGG